MTIRTVALVTGALGGMGQAVARRLGPGYRLALSDIDQERLDAFSKKLTTEGFEVIARHAGDYAQRGVAAAAVKAARTAGPLGAVVHTAGLSPVQADWKRILLTNIVATEELLRAIEADMSDSPAVILIASAAAHSAAGKPHDELDTLLDNALCDDLLQQAEPWLQELAAANSDHAMGMPAYAYSKFAVLRLAARRAAEWARLGRRIATISPGVVATPMGLAEQAANPAAKAAADAQPIKALTGEDIAAAAAFLISDDARAITGSDIAVDGGLLAGRRYP